MSRSMRFSKEKIEPASWASGITHIFIDCDGTAVDSDPVIDRLVAFAVNDAIWGKKRIRKGSRSSGRKPHTACANKSYRGQTFLQILESISAKEGVSFEPAELTLITERYETEKVQALREACPAHQVHSVLGALQEAGKILAMVSSSSSAAIDACLFGAQLGEFFPPERRVSASHSLDHYSFKPEPDCYIHTMQMFGVGAAVCIAVEDSFFGIQSARAAGLTVVAYGGCLEEALRREHEAKCMELGAVAYMHYWSQLLCYLGIPQPLSD